VFISFGLGKSFNHIHLPFNQLFKLLFIHQVNHQSKPPQGQVKLGVNPFVFISFGAVNHLFTQTLVIFGAVQVAVNSFISFVVFAV